MTITLLHGDNTEVLPTLPAQSVQCVVTSPPYYALRDYGLPPTLWPTVEYTPLAGLPPITIPGCDPDCAHEWGEPIRAPWANANPGPNGRVKNTKASRSRGTTSGESCLHCGGWRGALGLEPDPLAYVAHLVHVFRLVWRVLRDDGALWLNLGDSYSAGGNGGGGKFMAMRAHKGWGFRADRKGYRSPPDGLKEKDLLGIPWRVAYALQADGWYLRAENIWHKPNGMPEGAIDRTTRAHEQVFHLTKSERYSYNAAAVAVPTARSTRPQYKRALELAHAAGLTAEHFDAIRAAGITDTGKTAETQTGTGHNSERVQQLATEAKAALGGYYREFLLKDTRNLRSVWTVAPTVYGEGHFAVMPDLLVDPCILASSRPGDTVLDPFSGTGTVARVAERFGRNAIGIELNGQYLELSDRRTNGIQVEMEAYL
jgi:DNA modification methylase